MSNDETKNPISELVPRGTYAFPSSVVVPDGKGGAYWAASPGMTLRDWFAGQALAGNLASVPPDADPDSDAMARFSYRCADAMMRARESGQ